MKVDILGIQIDNFTGKEVLHRIGEFLKSNISHYIVTANPEMVVASQYDKEFCEIINKADLAVADGFGLILASRIIHCENRLTEKISGVDLIDEIAKKFGGDYKIFLLGGGGDTARIAAEKLKEKFPDVKISGFFAGDKTEVGDSAGVSAVNAANPDILFVAYGAPEQEKWISRNLKKLQSVKLAIGVGGAFDIISGKLKRAPLWMRSAGLEWLWRLIQEPRRIRRIYNATIKFGWLVLTMTKPSKIIKR